MKPNSRKTPKLFDAILVGGGLNGGTLALLLAEQGLDVAVIDREDPAQFLRQSYDRRTIALSHGSGKILSRAGVWDNMKSQGQPITDIFVQDGSSPFQLRFDHRDSGSDPIGHIIYARHIRGTLLKAMKANKRITLFAPAHIQSAETADAAFVTLGDGTILRAPLLIAADGKKSALRAEFGIQTKIHDYQQHAVITSLAHEKPHSGFAYEIFRKEGPVALLPMLDIDGQHCSSLVWTESPARAKILLDMDEAEFCALLQEKFGDYLGAFSLMDRRAAYPLSLVHAEKFYASRLALAGDAAHGIHPIAGQGLNLGLRGCAKLADLLGDAKRIGQDLGSEVLLRHYHRSRQADTLAMIASTHGLNAVFAVENPVFRLIRGVGLNMVERSPRLKQAFVRYGMGEFKV